MIRSVYGYWKGDVSQIRGLTEKLVLGKQVLYNETAEAIVYSEAEDSIIGNTERIVVEPEEAICFIDPKRGGVRTVIGPKNEIESWVRFYFYDPHMIPDPEINLTIENCFFKVMGVAVTYKVLRSYRPEVVAELAKILRDDQVAQSASKTAMIELLLSWMNKD